MATNPYVKTVWVNDEPPSIDDTNLNHIEQGIYDATAGVIQAESDIALHTTDILELSSDLGIAESNISLLQSNMTTAQNAIGTLQRNVTTAEGNITSLQTQMSSSQSDITSLQGRVTTAEGNITSLQTSVGSIISVPTGGNAGQVLAKQSASDGDIIWSSPSGGSYTVVDYTLLASGWDTSNSNRYYIQDTHITANSLIELTYPTTLGSTEYDALVAANIRPVDSVVAGQLTIRARNTVPTIDIAIQLVIWG